MARRFEQKYLRPFVCLRQKHRTDTRLSQNDFDYVEMEILANNFLIENCRLTELAPHAPPDRHHQFHRAAA
jgi:hypothetical protein